MAMLLGVVAPARAQQHDAEARDAYAQGRAAYEGKRYEEALEKFKRSYTLSGEAALLYNIASALQSLNRPGEAAAILRDYLSARPTDPNRAELEGRIASLGKAQQMLDRENERKAKAARRRRSEGPRGGAVALASRCRSPPRAASSPRREEAPSRAGPRARALARSHRRRRHHRRHRVWPREVLPPVRDEIVGLRPDHGDAVRYASALACILALGACARSEILLTISESGLVIGTDIDNLQIEVQPASDPPTTGNWYFSKSIDLCADPGQPKCQPQSYVDSDYKDALTFPIALLIMPGDSSFSADIRVWVNGYERGKQVMAAGDRFPFAKGKRLYVDIPLYAQCLGDLSCQALDQACASDLNCVTIPTTTTPNPADMAGSPPPDASMHGDLSVACGQLGLNCCDGSSCESTSLTCGAVSKICYSSSGRDLRSGRTERAMGDQEPCSASAICVPGTGVVRAVVRRRPSCGNGQVCTTDGACIVCGGLGEPCCDGNTCADTTATYCNGMTCARVAALNGNLLRRRYACASPTSYMRIRRTPACAVRRERRSLAAAAPRRLA